MPTKREYKNNSALISVDSGNNFDFVKSSQSFIKFLKKEAFFNGQNETKINSKIAETDSLGRRLLNKKSAAVINKFKIVKADKTKNKISLDQILQKHIINEEPAINIDYDIEDDLALIWQKSVSELINPISAKKSKKNFKILSELAIKKLLSPNLRFYLPPHLSMPGLRLSEEKYISWPAKLGTTILSVLIITIFINIAMPTQAFKLGKQIDSLTALPGRLLAKSLGIENLYLNMNYPMLNAKKITELQKAEFIKNNQALINKNISQDGQVILISENDLKGIVAGASKSADENLVPIPPPDKKIFSGLANNLGDWLNKIDNKQVKISHALNLKFRELVGL
jgi:hypothetical protein